MEQKWQNEVEEAQQGKLENNTPFFHDYHFFEVHCSTHTIYNFPLEIETTIRFDIHNLLFCFGLFSQNKIKELELLCSLKEVPLDFSDLENVVLALRQVIKNDSSTTGVTDQFVQ